MWVDAVGVVLTPMVDAASFFFTCAAAGVVLAYVPFIAFVASGFFLAAGPLTVVFVAAVCLVAAASTSFRPMSSSLAIVIKNNWNENDYMSGKMARKIACALPA